MAETSEPRRIPLRDGWVDLDRRLVVRGERQVVLSPTEARLLGWMAARPGQLFSRAALLEHVWGYNPNVSSRTTDITMHRLRLKIEAYPDNPDHLITEHSKGYRFAPAAVYGALPLKVTLARSNLQPETNRFVGREADLNDIAGRLEAAPLVTLLGTGGLGKTRLARRYAARLLERDPPAGGVWFCDLVTARDAGDVLQVLAAALKIPLTARQSPEEAIRQLGRGLADRGPCLLVLDNLEQIVGAVRELVVAWLALAPSARWLTTSRRPLGLPEESTLSLAALSPEEALALFVERVRTTLEGFDPGEDAGRLTALLTEQLDGLPLAIELAASRMGMLSVDQLIALLDQRFRLLRSGGRIHGRHAALQTTIDWSWDLLTDDERQAFVLCGAFAGGFGDGDAAAVLGSSAAALERLQGHSLVIRAGGRWRLLESIRVYARERLEASDEHDAILRAHGEHYAALGEASAAALRGPEAREATEALEAARADLQQAFEGSADSPERAARLALALDAAHEWRGRLRSRITVLEAALERGDAVSPGRRIELMRRRADALRWLGSPESEPVLDEAIALARSSAQPAALGRALGNKVALLLSRGEMAVASELAQEALSLHRASGSRWYEALTHYHLAIAAHYTNHREAAQEQIDQATVTFRALGDRLMEGRTLLNSGIYAWRRAEMTQARGLLQQSLALAREVDNPELLADTLHQLGHIALSEGSLDDAERYYQEFSDWTAAAGRSEMSALIACSLTAVALERGDLEEARAIMEASPEAPEGPNAQMRPFLLGVIARLEGRSDEAVRQLREAESCCEDNPSAQQSVWLHLGPALADTGALEQAAAVLERSVVWRDEHGTEVDHHAIEVALAHLDLARERAASEAEDEAGAARHAAARLARMQAASALAEESADLARMLRALEAQLG